MPEIIFESEENFRPVNNQNLFVIYYGWLISDPDGTPNAEAQAIAAARPALLVASFYTFDPVYPNLSPQVRDLMHEAGIRIYAYVDTDYAQRDRNLAIAEAGDYLSQGVDGIFYDQVCNFLDNKPLDYYQELYDYVHNQGKSVIVNPGIGKPGEEIMNVTDILMVEHAWRELYQTNSWFANYPSERFMGNSSNEYPGYEVDNESAVRYTRESWENGVGWHFSTDRYITLPDWFGDYIRGVGYNL
jgi:hypothetical protein